MKIKNVELKNNLILAPMAGVTEVAFRELCKKLGAGLTVTEMISVKGLYYNSKNTVRMLEIAENEHPVAVQLFGHEPEIFSKVIQSGKLDKFDIIDINMGCPAPKIVKNGDGSALMQNIALASEIIKACVSSTDKPVTVKFRKGFLTSDDCLIEFAKMCEESGASAITVHPRTRAQMFGGKIDVLDIKKVKDAVKIPVIGNGDVVDKLSYEHMLTSNCDGIMIGRKALSCPDIFLTLQNKDSKYTIFDIAKMHIELLTKYYDKNVAVKIFKKHAVAYLSHLKGASELKSEIVRIDDFDKLSSRLLEILKQSSI